MISKEICPGLIEAILTDMDTRPHTPIFYLILESCEILENNDLNDIIIGINAIKESRELEKVIERLESEGMI